MNAYELADELEGFGYLNSDDGLHFSPFQAQADMLRQLQDDLSDLQRHIPAKTLTDEEITSLFRASSDHIEFARAILRKAQDK
jgi:hypothetical protein